MHHEDRRGSRRVLGSAAGVDRNEALPLFLRGGH